MRIKQIALTFRPTRSAAHFATVPPQKCHPTRSPFHSARFPVPLRIVPPLLYQHFNSKRSVAIQSARCAEQFLIAQPFSDGGSFRKPAKNGNFVYYQ